MNNMTPLLNFESGVFIFYHWNIGQCCKTRLKDGIKKDGTKKRG